MHDITLRQAEMIRAVMLRCTNDGPADQPGVSTAGISLLVDDWRRALISEREDMGRYFHGIITRALSLVLFVAMNIIFVCRTPLWRAMKRWLLREPPGAGETP